MNLSPLIAILAFGFSFSNVLCQSSNAGIGSKDQLDLDSILKSETNTYLVHLKNDKLSFCNYELLNIPETINYNVFSAKTETYSLEKKVQRVNVYRSDSSFVKTYFNKHPKVNRRCLVSGRIYSNKLFASPDVRIGMTKEAVLNIIFKPSALYTKINRLTIYENESGDAMTLFVFKDNKLAEIRFDSSYDWINKGL